MEFETTNVYITHYPNSTEDFTQSSNDTSTAIRYPDSLMKGASVCFVLFTILGVSGNFISILALAKCPQLRNATTAFIINLCVADLIFCSFSSPLQAVIFSQKNWNFGDGLLCKLFPFVSYSNALVSLFTVVAITINRYICIAHNNWYPALYRPRYVGAMIVTIWLSILTLMSLPFSEVWGRLGYDEKRRTCTILPQNGKSPKSFIFGVALLFPTVTFIICYSRIFWIVRKAAQKVHALDIPNTSQDGGHGNQKPHLGVYLNRGEDGQVATEVPKVRRDRKELKVLRVTLIIFLSYVLCFFPLSLVQVIKKDTDIPALYVLGFVLIALANCINPIIYIVFSSEYRKAYFRLFAYKNYSSTTS